MTPVNNQNGSSSSPSPSPSPSSQSKICGCGRIVSRLIWVVVVLLVMSCLSLSIAWQIYHPHLPAITINSFTVSNFTLFRTRLTGNGNMSVYITNPNGKVNLQLDDFKVLVTYRKTVLSEKKLEGEVLYLGKKGEKVSMVELGFEGEQGIEGCEKVLKEWGWNRNNKGGGVEMEVEMFISTKFIAGKWLSRRRSTWVLCKVELSPSSLGMGKLLHGAKHCIVDFSTHS